MYELSVGHQLRSLECYCLDVYFDPYSDFLSKHTLLSGMCTPFSCGFLHVNLNPWRNALLTFTTSCYYTRMHLIVVIFDYRWKVSLKFMPCLFLIIISSVMFKTKERLLHMVMSVPCDCPILGTLFQHYEGSKMMVDL